MNGSWNCQAVIYTLPWNFKTRQVLNQNRTCMTQVGTPHTVSSFLQLICSPFVESLLVYYDHKLLFWARTALKADTKAGIVSWLFTQKRQEYSLFYSPLKRTELNLILLLLLDKPYPGHTGTLCGQIAPLPKMMAAHCIPYGQTAHQPYKEAAHCNFSALLIQVPYRYKLHSSNGSAAPFLPLMLAFYILIVFSQPQRQAGAKQK